MKKRLLPLFSLFSKRKKFQKDKKKTYLKKHRLYFDFMYSRLDKWLNQMSAKGWHLVHCGIFSYLFEKGEPMQKVYFTYHSGSTTRDDGYFNVPLRHPFLESVYGVKKKKSKLNANESKARQIVEIDTKRIDVERDIGYRELIHDRNRLYLLKACRNLGILAGFVILIVLFFILKHVLE